MRAMQCVLLLSLAALRPAAAGKTQNYHALVAMQELKSVLLGVSQAKLNSSDFWTTDDEAMCMEYMQDALELEVRIEDGLERWTEVDRARRARAPRRCANSNDLRIAEANGFVPWYDAVLEGGRASEGAYLEFFAMTYPMFDHFCSLSLMTPSGARLDPSVPRRGRRRKLNNRQMCAYGLHHLTTHDTHASMAHLFGIHPGTAARTAREAQRLCNQVFKIWDKSGVGLPSPLAQQMLAQLRREHTNGEFVLSDAVFARNKPIWGLDGWPARTQRSGNRFVQSAFFQTKAGYHCTIQVQLLSPTGCTDAYTVNTPGRGSEVEAAQPIIDLLRNKNVTIEDGKAYTDSLFRIKEFQDVLVAVPKAVEKIASWDGGNLAVTTEKARNTMQNRFSVGAPPPPPTPPDTNTFDYKAPPPPHFNLSHSPPPPPLVSQSMASTQPRASRNA